MKVKIFTAILALLLVGTLVVAAHENRPGKAEVTISGKSISIAFSAPHLKGRSVAELLQHPSANPWRMGADVPTELHTKAALQFGEDVLQPGIYTLQAYRDDSDSWWLRAVKSREVVGKLPLEASQASASEDYLIIALADKGSKAGVKVQWGTHVLKGSFSVAKK